MKKIILAAALFLMSLCFGDNISAGNFGVIGGANFHTSHPKDVGAQTLTQWHAGLLYKFNLPLGFQLQPTVLYNVKAATSEITPIDFSVGYLDFIAALQWGVDLILFRPYLEVAPFAGYGLESWGDLKGIWQKDGEKWEYGVGLGGGLQIWRFQFNARYVWNFSEVIPQTSAKELMNKMSFNGVTLSLAYFF